MKINWILCILFAFLSCSSSKNDEVKPTEQKRIKILSFNIRHGAPQDSETISLENIASAIRSSEAEVIALQEVDKNTRRAGNDQAKELAKLLDMNYFFSKSIDYQGGDYGVAILSKLPILESRRIDLPNNYPNGEKRSIAYVTIELPDKSKLDFASTHLDLILENRKEQIEYLNTLGKQAVNPLMIAGDFNAEPKDGEIALLKGNFTFPCNENCPLTFPTNKPAKTIDFIISNDMASKKFSSLSYLALANHKSSDHLPLLGVYSY